MAAISELTRQNRGRARERVEAATTFIGMSRDEYMEAPSTPLDGPFMRLLHAVEELRTAVEILSRPEDN